MKNILKGIGGFFAKIWGWIKNTAWVQPLLIVGIIFGVIFAIPSVSGWIKGLVDDANSASSFYEKYKVSLSGIKESDAQTLITKISENTNGDKFFLMFVKEDSAECANAKEGFETLAKEWNKSYKDQHGEEKFKLVTIFVDEETDETLSNKSAFAQFLDANPSFFEDAASVGLNSNYYNNKHIGDTDLSYLESADAENFVTPTILLIDPSAVDEKDGQISEVMFSVSGSNSFEKAQLLLNCWNSAKEFAEK